MIIIYEHFTVSGVLNPDAQFTSRNDAFHYVNGKQHKVLPFLALFPMIIPRGEMAERLKAPLSKSGIPSRVS